MTISAGRNVGERIGVCLLSDTVAFDAGTERQVVETAKRLDKTKFDVHVCCLEPSSRLDGVREYCHTAVFPTIRVNSWTGVRQSRQFRRYLEHHGIRIVHAHMNKTALFAVLSSIGLHRVIVTSRLNTGYWYTPSWCRYFRFLNLATDCVMANSEEAKRIAIEAEHLSPNKVAVIYQGVDMTVYNRGLGNAAICEDLGIAPSHRVVGIVANLRPVKDVSLFVRSAHLVARKCDDVVFLIVGRGEQFEELQRLVADLGLTGRVFFTQGRGAVIDYLARMCIGCLTSKSEGFSNAILEYMATGLPVVATDVGGNREAVVDGKTGYLVSQRTPESFATLLLRLLGDEPLRARMGCAGYHRCIQNFEIGITIHALERFYQSLVTPEDLRSDLDFEARIGDTTGARIRLARVKGRT